MKSLSPEVAPKIGKDDHLRGCGRSSVTMPPHFSSISSQAYISVTSPMELAMVVVVEAGVVDEVGFWLFGCEVIGLPVEEIHCI